MIINLGERTQTNFGNMQTVNDVDMLVGSTDIVTGASHMLHPSNKNLNPKMRPKHDFGKRAGSYSGLGSSTDLKNEPMMTTAGAQDDHPAIESPSITPVGVRVDSGLNNRGRRIDTQPDSDPMHIQSLSPPVAKMR